MTRRIAFAVLASSTLSLAASCSIDLRGDDRARIDELAAAERAFAASAARNGVRAAFLDVLADDATLFRPGPVAGKPFVSDRPDGAFRLAWQPQRVAVSASGDLGYSTGPFRLTLDAGADEPRFGQYFSVWRREADDRWTLLIDHGASHAAATGWNAPFVALVGDGSTTDRTIATAEEAFARATRAGGVAAAYRRYGSSQLRVLRDDADPIDGVVAMATRPEASERWTWIMTNSGTSRAGDFAWTRGRYRAYRESAQDRVSIVASTGFYARVWRVEGGEWKLLADILAPTADAAH